MLGKRKREESKINYMNDTNIVQRTWLQEWSNPCEVLQGNQCRYKRDWNGPEKHQQKHENIDEDCSYFPKIIKEKKS